jgi:hypothetical protein
VLAEDALATLVERVLPDPQFLSRAVADPERVLAEAGVEVSPAEREATREFAARFAGKRA